MTAIAVPARTSGAGLGAALRWETRKLVAQVRTKAVLLAALVGPIPVVLVVHAQTTPPKDTLFGRFAPTNGFAIALLILGFAGQWILPLLAAVVAGDVFASEDTHGTWKTVLTRSTSRASLFWAKVVASAIFSTLVLVVLAASTIVTSLLVVGHQPLVGLTGQMIGSSEALRLVSLSWLSALPPTLGFTALAIVLSVATRSPAAGIAAPAILALAMQLLGTVGTFAGSRGVLLSTAYEAWHGLLAAPAFTGPLVQGVVISAVWSLVCLGLAFVMVRRRDITGG